MHCRERKDLFHLGLRAHRGAHRLIHYASIANQSNRELSLGRVWNDVRRAPARDGSDIHRGFSEDGILWHRHLANRIERIEQFFDRGFAQLRIRRMRHFAGGYNLIPQNAFRPERNFAFRWLAVDQILRSPR